MKIICFHVQGMDLSLHMIALAPIKLHPKPGVGKNKTDVYQTTAKLNKTWTVYKIPATWWRHQMETFSALLAI